MFQAYSPGEKVAIEAENYIIDSLHPGELEIAGLVCTSVFSHNVFFNLVLEFKNSGKFTWAWASNPKTPRVMHLQVVPVLGQAKLKENALNSHKQGQKLKDKYMCAVTATVCGNFLRETNHFLNISMPLDFSFDNDHCLTPFVQDDIFFSTFPGLLKGTANCYSIPFQAQEDNNVLVKKPTKTVNHPLVTYPLHYFSRASALFQLQEAYGIGS